MENKSETELPFEAVEKWDRDLETIRGLSEVSESLGGDVVLKGGIATEAYTNGKIKRPHGDIDATYYLTPGVNFAQISSKVEDALASESTKWVRYNPESTTKIEFREDNENIEFVKRRRLELYVRENVDPTYESGKYKIKQLFSSTGVAVEVKVMDLPELLSMKIHNLYMSENNIGEQGRPANQNDVNDLISLFEIQEFDAEETILQLSKLLKSIPDPSMAIEAAQKEYDFVTNFLENS